MKIKAIETQYLGTYYRSRLEARWRIFFDTVGLPVEYEIVGLDFNGVWYLPDFYIPKNDIHIEIKPANISDSEVERLAQLKTLWSTGLDTRKDAGRFWLIQGAPAFGRYEISSLYAEDMVFARCRRCDGLCSVNDNGDWCEIGKHTCGDHDRTPTVKDDEMLLAAYVMAMKKRFKTPNPSDMLSGVGEAWKV